VFPPQLPAHAPVPPQALCPLWGVSPDASAVQVPRCPYTSQASQDPSQALSQQRPSVQGMPPSQSAAALQVCPLVFLHAPVESQVPAQEPGSSWPLTAVHTPLVHVWHAPAQSLLVTHPTHWLLAVSHLAATPVQYLSAVHATHRPLLEQAGPFRPVQSVSAAHFAHRLSRHSGLSGEQSLSVLQVPGASTVGASGARSRGRASGAVTTAGLSGGAESATDPSSPGPALAPPEPPAPPLVLAPPEPPNPPIPPDPAPPPAASERPRPSIFSGPSLLLPPTGTQRKSAVQAKPYWHISAGGEQTLQSRSPAPAASVDPWLSTATRPSVPLSGSTQRQSSVQTYPGLHGALDAQ
jgi:hypothetical protein